MLFLHVQSHSYDDDLLKHLILCKRCFFFSVDCIARYGVPLATGAEMIAHFSRAETVLGCCDLPNVLRQVACQLVRPTLLFNYDLHGAFSYWLCALRTLSCPAADPEEVPGLHKSTIALCRRHAGVLLAQVLAALLILGSRVTGGAPQ